MEETKQPQLLVLALGRGYNGFYCPETRFHLVGVMRPSAVYPFGTLSEDVKRGLRGGTLIDVNGAIEKEALKPGKGFVYGTTSSDRKKAITVQADDIVKKEQDADIKLGVEKDDYAAPNFANTQGELISEPDIQTSTKKNLTEFIDKAEGIDLDSLGLNSRSTLDEMKEALMEHYGYNEKPVNVSKVKADTTEDNE